MFRLASYQGDTEFMEEQGYDQRSIAELTAMLQSCGALDSLEQLCDAPFQQVAWPDLTHDSDYRFCNGLGTEAKKASLDGLLAPSVRHNGGTNVPVFVRSAIGQARDLTLLQITCHPPSG